MIQKPKGTYDLFGKQGKEILYLENLIKALMEKYNYEYVRTPLFEARELFYRGVGETSDIVSKETYDFIDRGNRNLTLRPEGTAGVARSFIENKLYGRPNLPVKCWYYGPMYRYERPQSGRFREFYQFGLEAFGTNDPLLDVEVISIVVNLYKLLGLKNLKVKINSLGDIESRNNYHTILTEYLAKYISNLCPDCQKRFKKNPLRILDCKVDCNLDIIVNAPKTIDYLNETSLKHFELVKQYLQDLNIDFIVDKQLVRGLDYYTHTVFEIAIDIKEIGVANILCGGGRYNNLISDIGGSKTPGVGVAIGMERLLQVLELENIVLPVDDFIDVYVMPLSFSTKGYCLNLVQDLRMNGFIVDIDYMDRNFKSNFKQADRLHSKFIIMVGNDEISNNILTVKDNEKKEQFKIKKNDIIDFLDERLNDIND
ncbi:MAG: histidine--tRNA ligase [Bacilli bacterium]